MPNFRTLEPFGPRAFLLLVGSFSREVGSHFSTPKPDAQLTTMEQIVAGPLVIDISNHLGVAKSFALNYARLRFGRSLVPTRPCLFCSSLLHSAQPSTTVRPLSCCLLHRPAACDASLLPRVSLAAFAVDPLTRSICFPFLPSDPTVAMRVPFSSIA